MKTEKISGYQIVVGTTVDFNKEAKKLVGNGYFPLGDPTILSADEEITLMQPFMKGEE